ncbi:MAG TPA: hypothetical protein VG122_19175, partial [Gemmata sp.]|nr:hypothetical protein [Gemmata sp.]
IGLSFTHHSIGTALAVNTPAMQQETVSHSLSSAADVEFYQINLQQGDFVSASVAATGTGPLAGTLEVLNSSGTVLTESSTKVFTKEGAFGEKTTSEPLVGFYASQAGSYYLEMTSVATTSTASRGYNLNLERIALNDSLPTNHQLAQGGAFHSWLDQAGDTLNITGPTGYGFSLEGKWSEIVSGSKVTYSATGGLKLETPALAATIGSIALAVPKDQTFSVTTSTTGQPQLGTLTGVNGDLGMSLSPIAGILDSTFGINVSDESVLNGFTIETGAQVMQNYQNGAGQHLGQMLGGIPYLVYGNKASVNLNFDGISVGTTDQSKTVIVADPADPFLYVGYGNYAVAGSVNGRIPFDTSVPVPASAGIVNPIANDPTLPVLAKGVATHLAGNPALPVLEVTGAANIIGTNPNDNFGQIYATAAFPLGGIPLTVSGGVTVNLDAKGDGKLLEGAGTASQLFQGDFKGVENVLTDIDVGVNGAVSLGYSIGGVSVTVPLGNASAVYDGPQQAVFFTGTQGSAVWEGTALADFNVGPGAKVQGYIYGNGQFSVSTTGNYMVSAMNAALTITVSNQAINATGTVTTPIGTADVSGTIDFNGTFTLSGEATVNIGGGKNFISGAAGFVLTNADSELTFDFSLNCSAQLEIPGVKAMGRVTGDLDLVMNSEGHLTFDYASLNFSGSVYVYDPFIQHWNDLGSASAGFTLNGNELSFDALGHTFSIDL